MPKGNPQLEDGYTKISNLLLEDIMRAKISKEELLIALAIVRKTYGWNKKEAPISTYHFSDLTGLNRRNAIRGIKKLLDKDLIKRKKGKKLKYGKPVYNYRLEKKNWCQWDARASVNRTLEPSVNRTHIKEKKEILKKGRDDLLKKLSAN